MHDAVGVEPPHARRAVDAVSLGAQVGRLVAAHVGGGVHGVKRFGGSSVLEKGTFYCFMFRDT